MKKKPTLKQTALRTLIGLAIAGTTVSLYTPLSYAQGNDDGASAIVGDASFEISDIIFEPKTASPGDTVKVRALTNASRHKIFSVMLEIPVNNEKSEQVYLTHGENDILEGSFTIGDNWSNGEHRPLKVTVTDTEHTSFEYDISATNMGSITVYDSSEDFDAPVLNSITYDKTEFRKDEAVTISVDVTHASDIEEIIVTFADEGNQTHSVNFENGSKVRTKDLSGWDEGTYRVVSVFIRDKAGNREYYEENNNLDGVALSEFTISNAYEDTQGPLVTRVSFTPLTAGPGDTVEISAKAKDSTKTDFITVDITAPDGEVQSLSLFDDEKVGFSSKFTIDNRYLNGEYTVTHISAVDTLGNRSEFVPGDDTKDLTVDSFIVNGSSQDRAAPHIKTIMLTNGSRFRPGETAVIKLWLADKSDITEARLHLFEEDTNDEFDYFDGELQDDGSYLFKIPIDNQWFNGNYDIRISTADSLNNTDTHETGLQITVHDSPEDYDPPKVLSLTSDKTEVKPDDVVTLTAKVIDDSIIDYVFAGLFHNGETIKDDEGNEILFPFVMGEDGLFRAIFEITHRFLNVDYEVKISTNDQWWNFQDDMDTDVVISVSGSQEYLDPPVVTSIMFDKTECVPGDTFTMTATAEDEVDIKYVKVYLAPSDGSYDGKYNPHLFLTLYPDENGVLSATELVDNTWMNKTYEAVHVIAKDVLGNSVEYDNELLTDLFIAKELDLNFLTVSGSSGKESELHVSEILFDKEHVTVGETINITAKTTGSGTAKEIQLEISDTPPVGMVWNKKIVLTPDEDGIITGQLRIEPSESFWRNNLEYGIAAVLLLDSENDSRYYADGMDTEVMDDLRDIEKNSFTVDTYAPPVINPADYTAVDAALANVPEDLSLYLPDSVEALNDAIEAVVRDKTELEQLVVNGYAAAIRNAIEALDLKPADYTGVDEAISSVPEDLGIYTEDSVSTLNKALQAVVRDLKIDKQDIVDRYARNISKAIKKLELLPADYTAVDKAMEIIPEDLSLYTDETVNVLNEVLDKVDRTLKIDKQDLVDTFAVDIEAAVAGLEKKAEPEPEPKKKTVPEEKTEPEKKKEPEKKSTPANKAAVVTNNAPAVVSAPVVAENNAPKTGDNSSVILWSTVSGISIAGIGAAAVIILRKRNKR